MTHIAKQVWCLITIRDSVCFKVLFVRYFSDGNILDATLGDKPSFIGRGIFHAKEEFKDGFHWRLGTNSTISMFQAKWGGSYPVTLATTYVDNIDN
ncbi:hypothetical protein V6N13_025467 [Hibiscus sabdariffa]